MNKEYSLKTSNDSVSYTVDINGIQIRVPVVYEELSALLLFFPANEKKVREFINCERVTSVKISKNTCLLALTVFDYTECPTGPYRELAISFPVMLDKKISVPILPLIFEYLFKNYGFYTNLLAMNTDIARAHSEKIFGYPTYHKNIKIDLLDQGSSLKVSVVDGSQQILSIMTKYSESYKKIKGKNYNTFFTKNGKLCKVKMTVDATVSHSFFGKDCLCDFSNHEICDKYINKFLLSNKPLYQMYYKQAVEVLSNPTQI